jgi:hypothetical protein
MAHALEVGTAQQPLGTALGTMHIHLTRLVGVRGWTENQVLWCNAHNVRVRAWMAELAVLQLVQLVGARSTTRGSTNQEVRASPPPGFPHTMLSVERVKDNMQLAFIEKLFTNYEIGTNVQTKYLRFNDMSYESESYLCDISCVQLRKTLARFRCGNTQLEVVLGAWKGVCHTQRGFVRATTWGR